MVLFVRTDLDNFHQEDVVFLKKVIFDSFCFREGTVVLKGTEFWEFLL